MRALVTSYAPVRGGRSVLIASERPEPQLVELLADLNPLDGGPGLPSPGPLAAT